MTSTETKPLSVEEVRALLVRAVEEKGADYVYPQGDPFGPAPTCNYFRNGEPSCIVGHVLAYTGLSEDEVPGEGPAYEVVPDVLKVSPAALAGLQSAQGAQDAGKTWGEALEAFDKAVEARS